MENAYENIPIRNKAKKIVAYSKCSIEDYDVLNKLRWFFNKQLYPQTYYKGKTIPMHRFIFLIIKNTKIDAFDVVDHINNDKLDNQRCNLRLCTQKNNLLNRKKRKDAISSDLYGVGLYKDCNTFFARGRINNKTINIGSSDYEEDAGMMYDIWCLNQNDSKYRKLNFPQYQEGYLNGTIVPRANAKRTKTSNYIGVSNSNEMFTASTSINGTIYKLLKSDNELMCAYAYDDFVVQNKLDRNLNFPNRYPDYEKTFTKTQMIILDTRTCKLICQNDTTANIIIDLEDYDKIKHFTICSVKSSGYASFNSKNISSMLHRFLMNAKAYDIIDHINGNKQDNRKSNLRLSNLKLNAQNRTKSANTTSKYVGVSRDKRVRQSFRASVTNNFKRHAKTFSCEEHAARYRDIYIMKNIPDNMYKMNFVWNEQDIQEWTIKFNL